MNAFENEINEAKRRVMEMNEKAEKFSREVNGVVEKKHHPEMQNPSYNNESGDSSFLLILALIVLLSSEKADTKILIALLYLLM